MSGSHWLALVAGLSLTALAGCSSGRRVQVPSLDPQAAGRQALSEYDTNKDGAIAGAELDRCPGLKAGLAVIDRNRDGRVTADEIAARLTQYQEDKVGLTQLFAHVTLNSKPLGGAVVTLVPEKFMGSAVQPATGTTDADGYCSFQVEGAELPGVHCGVFRVEVSKEDSGGRETLPARYNAQTTLGEEVGLGSAVMNRGILLKLSSR